MPISAGSSKVQEMKNRLKVFRAMHDLTQEALADRLRVTRQTVVSLENGKYDPSLPLAFRIAGLFNIKIEDVFLYEGEPGEFHGYPPVSDR
jgi:putative transcriptional regulator